MSEAYRAATNDASGGDALAYAKQQDLMGWEEVAREMTKRLGTPISRSRCIQIAVGAEDKIADALWSFARDEGWVP
ncbi:MAG: hypothetical protein AAGI54_00570 [Planctomycetota bacterium]